MALVRRLLPVLRACRDYSKASEADMLSFFRTKYVLPDGISARPATKADYAQVLQCAAGELGGLDHLPAYYDRFFEQPTRRCLALVHSPTQHVVFFGNMHVVDDGRMAIANGARVRGDLRGHSLFQFGLSMVHQIAAEFPDVARILSVTRHDNAVLEPRFSPGGLQRNKLVGTNNYLNVAVQLSELEKVTGNIRDFDLHVSALPYSKTSEAFAKSKKLKSLALGREYVVVDNNPYSVNCESNFTQNIFNTQVLVGSATDRSGNLQAADSISFVNVNPALAGIHVRAFLYSSSLDATRKLLKSTVANALNEVHKVRQSSDLAKYTKNPDLVHVSVAFPVALKPEAIRKWLYEAGFQPGVSGTDIQRQYLHMDESLCALWQAGAAAGKEEKN